MGLRQRLSLAVAVLHEPQILILDEPTSGVDPVARDSFWELLIDLSRKQGVTIFVTTHFMNEGMRCDRISLMNAGKVLACDAPQKLIEARGAAEPGGGLHRLHGGRDRARARRPPQGAKEEQRAASRGAAAPAAAGPRSTGSAVQLRARASAGCSPTRATRRMQILRDPVRLAFAFVGSALLMLVFGFGITTDVENIRYAALDLDQSPESRPYSRAVRGDPALLHPRPRRSSPPTRRSSACSRTTSRWSSRSRPTSAATSAGAPRRRSLAQVDGAMTFRGETIAQYVAGRARQPALRIPATGLPTAARSKYTADIERALHVQPDVREHLLDRAERPGAAAAPDPGDPDDGQHRAREGAGLDHQLLRHADRQARVPARQAAAVRRHRHDQLLHPDRSGADRLRRPDQGQLPDADALHAALRHGDDRHRHGRPRPSPAARSRPSSSRRSSPSCRRSSSPGCCSRSRRSRAAPGSSARSGRRPTTCTRAWAPTPRASGPA